MNVNVALIETIVRYLLLKLIPSTLVRNNDVYDFVLVQGLRHCQPDVLQAHLVAFVGIVVWPLQPGSFMRFPLGRHIIVMRTCCPFVHNFLPQNFTDARRRFVATP